MELIEQIQNGMGAEELLVHVKRKLTVAALELANGNQCRAALKLKVHRNTLARWMDELAIDPREFRVRRMYRREA